MRRRIGHITAAVLAVLALAAAPAPASAADPGGFVDLTPPGGETRAVDIAADGTLLGNTESGPAGYLWRAPGYAGQSLGPLGPHAEAVNDRGDAVGCTANGVGLYWHGGTITYVTRPGRSTCLYAINDAGVIAGASAAPGGGEEAFVWQRGTFTDLATPRGRASAPIAINDRGQVLGRIFGTTTSVPVRAVVWTGGSATDLGTLGGPQTLPTALGEDGSVTGTSSVDAKTAHPFRWADGRMTDLLAGTGVTDPHAYAAGVNATGDVVGTVADRPVLWRDGKLIYLGDAGEAVAVNAAGVVTGVVRGPDGAPTVFRWKDGSSTRLPNPAGATYCYAVGIADDGTVAGNVSIGDVNHAVVWAAQPK